MFPDKFYVYDACVSIENTTRAVSLLSLFQVEETRICRGIFFPKVTQLKGRVRIQKHILDPEYIFLITSLPYFQKIL